MGAHIARQVEQFLGREVGGGDPLEDLLGGSGARPSSPIKGLIVAPSMMSSA
jgi:hypothetical protein